MMLWPVQEKEMVKQRLLYQQSRLHNRGAAEMVLQMISACKGSFNPRVIETPFVPAKVQFQLQDWDCPSLARRRDWANGDDEPQTGYLHSQWRKHRSSAGMCSQSIKALAINQMKVTKLNIICSSPFLPENAGVPEGQEGRGLLLESPGTDADLLVSFARLICFVLVWFVTSVSNITLLFYAASWIWMPLRGRTRRKDSAWFPKRAPVSQGQALALMWSYWRPSVLKLLVENV